MTRRRKWTKELVLEEIRRLHKKLGRRPVKRDNGNLYRLSRLFFGTWNNVMKAGGYKIKNLQYINSISMSPNLSYLVGLVITDGHLQITKKGKKRYKVLIFTSYKKEKEVICRLLKKLFNYKPLVRERKYGWNVLMNYEIHISSKNFAEFLNKKLQIPTGAKSKSIRVPELFFTTSTKNIVNFLRGVIDGDGGVSFSHQSIEIFSASILFLEDLKKLLSKLEIISGKILRNQKVYELNISNKRSIKKLYNLIYPAEFFYPRKKLTLDKLLKELN